MSVGVRHRRQLRVALWSVALIAGLIVVLELVGTRPHIPLVALVAAAAALWLVVLAATAEHVDSAWWAVADRLEPRPTSDPRAARLTHLATAARRDEQAAARLNEIFAELNAAIPGAETATGTDRPLSLGEIERRIAALEAAAAATGHTRPSNTPPASDHD